MFSIWLPGDNILNLLVAMYYRAFSLCCGGSYRSREEMLFVSVGIEKGSLNSCSFYHWNSLKIKDVNKFL